MSKVIKKGKQGILTEIMRRPVAFSASFLFFFVISFAFLASVGATPNPLEPTIEAPVATETTPIPNNPENPVRVVAKDVGLDAAVVNPTSIDADVLDEALTHGALRYPTSNQLGINGTVALFGHSTSIPVVHNQYYKTFNGIQNLKRGAIVSVYSGTTEYRYQVNGVRVADAEEDIVDLPQDGMHLALVTCNSFQGKSKRFVVTADFAGAYEVGQQQ
jgi:LPXTG-site transpeptidase (sortase) family protein